MPLNIFVKILLNHFSQYVNHYFAVTAFFISFIVGYVVYSYETSAIELQFVRDVDEKAAVLEQEMYVSVEVLFALKAFYDNSNFVSYDEFRQFSKSFLARNSTIKALEWAPKLTHEQRLNKKYKSYRPNQPFVITEMESQGKMIKAGKQALYYPVYYIEPFSGNELAFGYDLLSNQARKQALLTAVETNNLIASKSFSLVQGDDHSRGFLIFLPVYEPKESVTAHANIDTIKGVIVGVFDIADIFEAAMSIHTFSNINIQLNDVTDEQSELLYQPPANSAYQVADILVYRKALNPFYTRKWQIVASPRPSYFDERRTWMPYLSILSSFLIFLFGIDYIFRLSQKNIELSKIRQKLEELVDTDALTGVYNKRFFNKISEVEWSRAIRQQNSLGLLMIDIDLFKTFNDTYGHQSGDICLCKVAQAIMKSLGRASDVVCRYGGEEFVVLLPDTDNVELIAENCRLAVEQLSIVNEKSTVSEYVTVSIGAVKLTPSPEDSLFDFINLADKLLYQAKAEGRNRVFYADNLPLN